MVAINTQYHAQYSQVYGDKFNHKMAKSSSLKYLRNDNGGMMILIVPQFIMQSKLYSKLLYTKNYTTFQENVRSCFKHVSSHSVCPTELNKLEINDACMLLCSLSTSHLTGNFQPPQCTRRYSCFLFTTYSIIVCWLVVSCIIIVS